MAEILRHRHQPVMLGTISGILYLRSRGAYIAPMLGLDDIVSVFAPRMRYGSDCTLQIH